MQDNLIQMVMTEGFLEDWHIAIDVTYFESRDAAKSSPKKEVVVPKKRGRKKREEREQWLQEKQETEENLPI